MFSSTFTMTVYDELKAHLNEEVPAGFVQVRGGKEILGYVKKDWAMAVASRTSDWRLTAHITLSEEAEVTPTKRAAAMIHAAEILDMLGLLQNPQHTELVDVRASVLDPVYCQAPRNLARAFGLLTTSVRMTGYLPDGTVMCAKRLATKSIGGGLWDSLAAGLVKASETTEQAIYRELFEEAGLTSNEVTLTEGGRFVQQLVVPEGMVREIVYHYDAKLSESAKPANRDGQVMEFATFTPDKVLNLALGGEMMYAAGMGLVESVMRRMGQRIEDKWMHYRGQFLI